MSVRFNPTTDRERQTGLPDFSRIQTALRAQDERFTRFRTNDAKMRMIEAKVGSTYQLPPEVMDKIKQALPTRNPHGMILRRQAEDRELDDL